MAGRSKIIHFLRHGQATHNVRAEGLRTNGCSYDTFLATMAEDDELDARLTDLGRRQAHEAATALRATAARIQVIVSSPLSRALDTADLVLPPSNTASCAARVVREEWREINGKLLNAKRSPTSELQAKYAGSGDATSVGWDFAALDGSEEDSMWMPGELEDKAVCARRAYDGLRWIWSNLDATHVAVVGHGGIFSYMMTEIPDLMQWDERLRSRFGNCELRSCEMTLIADGQEKESAGAESLPRFQLRVIGDSPLEE